MDVPLAFLLITLLLSLMHQISERRHSGLRAADKDKQRSEASMQVSFSIHHTLILPQWYQHTQFYGRVVVCCPIVSESAVWTVHWCVNTYWPLWISRNTWGLQTRTLMRHYQVEEGSLCLHHLHLQRNFQVQAGSFKKKDNHNKKPNETVTHYENQQKVVP